MERAPGGHHRPAPRSPPTRKVAISREQRPGRPHDRGWRARTRSPRRAASRGRAGARGRARRAPPRDPARSSGATRRGTAAAPGQRWQAASAAADEMNPSTSTSAPRAAAPIMAPAMAAISSPPTWRSTSSGIVPGILPPNHPRHGVLHHLALAGQPTIVNPRASAHDPVCRRPGQAGRHRSRRGGVRDAHLADAHEPGSRSAAASAARHLHTHRQGRHRPRSRSSPDPPTDRPSPRGPSGARSRQPVEVRRDAHVDHPHPAPHARASTLIAAPPPEKFAHICAVTSAGYADTPCAATP